jgi:hypothetical protein
LKITSIRGLRVIARKPRPFPAERCSIDLTDLADFFTVGRPNIVRKKLKISAQMDESFWRYRRYKYRGVGYIWGIFGEQYFSINFHFLNNNKSYNRDFFTINTIDHGLSFHGIKSILSWNIFFLILYTIFGKSDPRRSPEIRQVGRISALE